MEHIREALYDFYAKAISNQVYSYDDSEEVRDFYNSTLYPSLSDLENFSLTELKKRLKKYEDPRLDVLIEEMSRNEK